MTLKEDLVAKIAEQPENDDPKLVYADWLMERGDKLGLFIKGCIAINLAVENFLETDLDYHVEQKIRDQSDKLYVTTCEGRWLAEILQNLEVSRPIKANLELSNFSYGFPRSLCCPLNFLASKQGDILLENIATYCPTIRELELLTTDRPKHELAKQVVAKKRVGQLTYLGLSRCANGDNEVRAIIKRLQKNRPLLENLEKLNLRANHIDNIVASLSYPACLSNRNDPLSTPLLEKANLELDLRWNNLCATYDEAEQLFETLPEARRKLAWDTGFDPEFDDFKAALKMANILI